MYQVEITHNQEMAFTAKIGEEQLVIDAQGKGVTPLDALLAGLGSCIGVYIRKYAAGAKLELKNFKIKVAGELSGHPLTFKEIDVQVELKDCPLDERRQKALLEFIKNCPAHNTLKGSPQIGLKITC